jgi:uncharacterized protein YxjI
VAHRPERSETQTKERRENSLFQTLRKTFHSLYQGEYMNPIFQHQKYLLKRQVFALAGTFRIFDPMENLVMFSQQKMFKLREDIRVYSDENKTQEVLNIQARQILDFSAAYDVVDSTMNQKVGTLRRKGWSSMLRDEWQVLDANDNQIGKLFEDSIGLALLRRFLLGSWLPQNYDITFGEQRVADLKQRFNLFRYELDIDMSMDTQRQLDPRLGIAAGILLAAVEGRQSG